MTMAPGLIHSPLTSPGLPAATTTMSAWPLPMRSTPAVTGWLLEMHAIETVKAGTVLGKPAPSAASRATLAVWTFCTTDPMTTRSTCAGSMPVRVSKPLSAMRPRS